MTITPHVSRAVVSVGAVLFLAAPLAVGAQQSKQTQTPPEAVVIATVNVQDTKILSQDGNTFRISFNLSNRVVRQTGVKYGVQLIRQTKTESTLIDERVYPEVVTLEEHSLVPKEITYTAPGGLGGQYLLLVVSKNESGLPYGSSLAGIVKLSDATPSVFMDPTSCYLTVAGEKGTPHYNLLQGVDLLQTESLILSCNIVNKFGTTTTLTPSFETHYRTVYGPIVTTSEGSAAPITLAPNEQKVVSLTLPRASDPQAYDVSTEFTGNDVSSNTITAHYVVRGASATIQTVSLDKNVYHSGDTANLEFIWSQSAENFAGARYATTTPVTYAAEVQLQNGSGTACAAPVKVTLSDTTKIDQQVAVTKDCVNPTVVVTITDGAGKTLATRTVSSTTPATIEITFWTWVGIVALVLVILGAIIAAALYVRARKAAQALPTYRI